MNASRYLLVIDVGTGSGRSIIFDETGTQVSVCQRERSHPPDPRYPYMLELVEKGLTRPMWKAAGA
jgi:autoinducer-2 kinase